MKNNRVLTKNVAKLYPTDERRQQTHSGTLMVLLLGINGYQHDFSADEGFELVVGLAAGDIGLQQSSILIEKHLV